LPAAAKRCDLEQKSFAVAKKRRRPAEGLAAVILAVKVENKEAEIFAQSKIAFNCKFLHTVMSLNQFRIAYLVNQYPKVSHSFIRREILALESRGFDVERIALRGWDAELVDAEDRQERERTRYVLRDGASSLILALLSACVMRPTRFFAALKLALKIGMKSERPLPFHFVYLAEACRIVQWLNEFGAQHVHAHFGTNSPEIAMLAHVLGGPPFSFTVHGQDELYFGGMVEKVWLSKFVVAISSFGRSQLYLRLDYRDWNKVKVVHCGLDLAFHDVAPVNPPAEPRLVCVGRLCKEKGQLLLVEAAYQLAKMGMGFELVLAGDGEMRKQVEELVATYGLGERIRITGWLSSDQVRDEILASRGMVLPSFSEGLPVVIMEAMALRRPVLSTYVGGIPELVVPGETGWLCPAGSIDDLANAIRECLSMPIEALQKMGDAGYRRVMARHSVETESAKLAKLFLQ
jgi:colanic acid/amylovoran biosynthesis glycosyltransferase